MCKNGGEWVMEGGGIQHNISKKTRGEGNSERSVSTIIIFQGDFNQP